MVYEKSPRKFSWQARTSRVFGKSTTATSSRAAFPEKQTSIRKVPGDPTASAGLSLHDAAARPAVGAASRAFSRRPPPIEAPLRAVAPPGGRPANRGPCSTRPASHARSPPLQSRRVRLCYRRWYYAADRLTRHQTTFESLIPCRPSDSAGRQPIPPGVRKSRKTRLGSASTRVRVFLEFSPRRGFAAAAIAQ